MPNLFLPCKLWRRIPEPFVGRWDGGTVTQILKSLQWVDRPVGLVTYSKWPPTTRTRGSSKTPHHFLCITDTRLQTLRFTTYQTDWQQDGESIFNSQNVFHFCLEPDRVTISNVTDSLIIAQLDIRCSGFVGLCTKCFQPLNIAHRSLTLTDIYLLRYNEFSF